MQDDLFDQIADAELHELEHRLAGVDPDLVEVDLASGVLTLTLPNPDKIIINSHRAAGQIWMAAFRQAWHFSPQLEGDRYRWRTDKDELRSTLRRVLRERARVEVDL